MPLIAAGGARKTCAVPAWLSCYTGPCDLGICQATVTATAGMTCASDLTVAEGASCEACTDALKTCPR